MGFMNENSMFVCSRGIAHKRRTVNDMAIVRIKV